VAVELAGRLGIAKNAVTLKLDWYIFHAGMGDGRE